MGKRAELKHKYAIGHFTQMVWKGTTKVGYVFATYDLPNNGITTIVVARYLAAGNEQPLGPGGPYEANVGLLIKKDEITDGVINVITENDENVLNSEGKEDEITEKFINLYRKEDEEGELEN